MLALSVGFLSSRVTRPAVADWYVGLNKPFFNPPNWVFGPVWSMLYLCMGIAAGRVWYFGKHHIWGKTALYHYAAQLIFNGLWSLVFFGLQAPGWGLLVIFILLVLIQRTLYWFKLVDRPAAYLLYPYLAWVAFASVLNGAIVFLN